MSCNRDSKTPRTQSEIRKPKAIKEFYTNNLYEPQSFSAQKIFIFNAHKDYEKVRIIKDTSFIEEFNNHIQQFYVRGYLCCPESQFYLELLDTSNRRGYFQVVFHPETNFIILLSGTRNYGYKINKALWNKFYSKSKKAIIKKHTFTDFKTAMDFLFNCEDKSYSILSNSSYYQLRESKRVPTYDLYVSEE